MNTAHCLCVTVLAFSVGACVNHVPVDGMPCPCADGYTCCAITNRCLSVGQVCQADAGQSKWQPIASVSVNWFPTASEPFLMGDRVAFWDASNDGLAEPTASRRTTGCSRKAIGRDNSWSRGPA